MMRITYVDPAGNITAIVRGSVSAEHRISVSRDIINQGKAEQVGFEAEPILGGDCRLEMSGGEFCGNATRAYGYLHCLTAGIEESKDYNTKDGLPCLTSSAEEVSDENDVTDLLVEISGAMAPVHVKVKIKEGEAYTDMPLPVSLEYVTIKGVEYPLVHMEGIDHMIIEGVKAEEDFAYELLEYLKTYSKADAIGILFLEEDHMVPLVYVCETESLVWESSCGSGTCACSWYKIKQNPVKGNEKISFTFYEPGGILNTYIYIEEENIRHIWMGGQVKLL